MDLVERLKEHATGYEEWRVADPKDGSYVISFSWSESCNPERDAREWLADQLRRFPDSWVAGYEVRKVMVQGERDEMMREAADEITRLRTRLEIIPGTEIDGIDRRDETIRLQDAEIGRLRLVEGAQAAADERLANAAQRVGIIAGCDSAEWMADEIERLRADADESDALRTKLADILTRTANALKGEPGELQAHSWHDLPEWAGRLRDWNTALELELNACAATLLGSIYMDPPDGGSVTIAEQLARMAKDADRYRFLRAEHGLMFNAPIAQVVWKRNSDPQGEWVNVIDAADLDKHIDAAITRAAAAIG